MTAPIQILAVLYVAGLLFNVWVWLLLPDFDVRILDTLRWTAQRGTVLTILLDIWVLAGQWPGIYPDDWPLALLVILELTASGTVWWQINKRIDFLKPGGKHRKTAIADR